jgi:hypothetical protein
LQLCVGTVAVLLAGAQRASAAAMGLRRKQMAAWPFEARACVERKDEEIPRKRAGETEREREGIYIYINIYIYRTGGRLREERNASSSCSENNKRQVRSAYT